MMNYLRTSNYIVLCSEEISLIYAIRPKNIMFMETLLTLLLWRLALNFFWIREKCFSFLEMNFLLFLKKNRSSCFSYRKIENKICLHVPIYLSILKNIETFLGTRLFCQTMVKLIKLILRCPAGKKTNRGPVAQCP